MFLIKKKNNEKITVRKLKSLPRDFINEFDAISVISLNEASNGL